MGFYHHLYLFTIDNLARISDPSGSTNNRASGSIRRPLFSCSRMDDLLKESEGLDLAPFRTKRASTYKTWDPLMGQPNLDGYQEAKNASDLASAKCRDAEAEQPSKPYSSAAHFTEHFKNGRWVSFGSVYSADSARPIRIVRGLWMMYHLTWRTDIGTGIMVFPCLQNPRECQDGCGKRLHWLTIPNPHS